MADIQQERFATSDELRTLLEPTYEWLLEHGQPYAAVAPESFSEDGMLIAEMAATYSARLPLRQLRAHLPQAIATLGISRKLIVVAQEPFLNAHPGVPTQNLIASNEVVDFIGKPRHDSLYWILKYSISAPTPQARRYWGRVERITKYPRPDEEWELNQIILPAMTRSDELTLTHFQALRQLTTFWLEEWKTLSPGRSRRYKW